MYREIRLLYDAIENSVFDQQEVARVIAHELTHQVISVVNIYRNSHASEINNRKDIIV